MSTVIHPTQIVPLKSENDWEIDHRKYAISGPEWLDPGEMVEVIGTQGDNSVIRHKSEIWLLPTRCLT